MELNKQDLATRINHLQAYVSNHKTRLYLIDKWFKENLYKQPKSQHEQIAYEITLNILNHPNFFHSHHLSFYSQSQAERSYLSSELKSVIQPVIRHLGLNNQLLIWSRNFSQWFDMDNISGMLSKTKIDKNTPQNIIDNICIITTKLFNAEKFSEIDLLSKHLKYSVLNGFSKRFALFFNDATKRISYSSYPVLETGCAKPLYDIIFNYSNEKKDYANSRGVQLPTEIEAKSFIELLGGYFNKDTSYESGRVWLNNLDAMPQAFFSMVRSETLSNNLSKKNSNKDDGKQDKAVQIAKNNKKHKI